MPGNSAFTKCRLEEFDLQFERFEVSIFGLDSSTEADDITVEELSRCEWLELDLSRVGSRGVFDERAVPGVKVGDVDVGVVGYVELSVCSGNGWDVEVLICA